MATHAPSSSWLAPSPRSARRASGLVAGALAGLSLLAAAGVPGHGAAPAISPARVAPDPCVSPAAVATFAAWPPAPPIVDAVTNEAEVRGEQRPDALPVPAEFRAFQACRQRMGG